MNKDQIKGTAKEATGEVQEQFGKVIGSAEQQAKGHAREFEGKAQKKVGDVEEKIDDKADDIAKKP
ncbi:MAG: CsbD family protein [Ramlibacter sp.]|nr:CsbD family protein [Ramlibacter sp.]